MGGYLFVHFTGEHKNGEQIYFSISKDGLFWQDLNEGRPVLFSNVGECGVRDPFLVRVPKQKKFYLIATDLCIESGKGWEAAQAEGSKNLIVWESENLIDWSEPRQCRIGDEAAGCVWAPETVYDEEKEAFFVVFASMTPNVGNEERKQKIYGVWTKNFREFTKPYIYMEREEDVIDTTIVHTDNLYYRFTKDETNKKIIMEKGEKLCGIFEQVESGILDSLSGVEGPECYLLPDNQTWCLIVDRFKEGRGYLPLLTRNLEKGEFVILNETEYDFGKNVKRHGGIIRINEEEYNNVWRRYGN